MGKGLGLGKTSAPPTLPAPFQSVAQQAFDFGNEPEKKPAQPARGIASRMLGRLKLRYRVALSFGVAAAGGVILTFAAMMVYYTVAFPDPLALRNNDRAPLIRILARDGTTIAERGAAREYVRLSDLPKLIPAAVVATEDRRFFDHYGVDPIGMFRAMFANLRAGRFAQGGSTLTQQLAKNLFLTQERTLTRKVAELGLALWLEIRLSKEEILELYLNQCYFGSGAYGVGAASQRYFGKPARSLNLAEAAVIAGLLKAPSKYSPATNPDAARERGRVVLSRMLDAGFISPEQEKIALAQPVLFADPKTTVVAPDTGYVVDYILDQMPPISHTANGEVIVQTTLDRDLQRSAQRIVKETLARKGAAFGASQAALIVLDRDGGIRALVGGRDYAESQFDRAVKAKRQPGSAFKPFVYLAALDQGMTPDTVAFDGPITIGGWSPKTTTTNTGVRSRSGRPWRSRSTPLPFVSIRMSDRGAPSTSRDASASGRTCTKVRRWRSVRRKSRCSKCPVLTLFSPTAEKRSNRISSRRCASGMDLPSMSVRRRAPTESRASMR